MFEITSVNDILKQKKDDGDDDYSGRVKTPKKTPKKSKAATPKRGKGGKVEKRGRPAKAETPAKKSPAKKSKSPAKKAKTPKKETPKKAPAKKEPPKAGDENYTFTLVSSL